MANHTARVRHTNLFLSLSLIWMTPFIPIANAYQNYVAKHLSHSSIICPSHVSRFIRSHSTVLSSTLSSSKNINDTSDQLHELACNCQSCRTSKLPSLSYLKSQSQRKSSTDMQQKLMISQKSLRGRNISARNARVRIPTISSALFLLSSLSLVKPTVSFASTPPTAKSLGGGQKDFQSSLKTYFPGSISNNGVMKRIMPILQKRGFTQSNTVLGSSLCSDEILDGTAPRTLLHSIHDSFGKGGIFSLGGLGGIPFVGKTGFAAFFGHCPDGGRVFITYGPHVGVSSGDGTVGRVERVGQGGRITASCGAALGAYNAILDRRSGGMSNKSGGGVEGEQFDLQQQFIIQKLNERMEKGNFFNDVVASTNNSSSDGGSGSKNKEIAAVTQYMYNIIDDLMSAQIRTFTNNNPGFFDNILEVVLMGGIVINSGKYEASPRAPDYFQPLSMKAVNVGGITDLHEDAFGDLPTPNEKV